MKKIKNIVVTTDFSNTSRNVFEYAKGLAESLNATLTLVNVRENFMMVSDVTIAPFPLISNQDIIKKMEKFIEDERLKFDNVLTLNKTKIKVLHGDPANTLIELSKTEDVDLIVVGTTGASGVLTKIFGSTAAKISADAICPVLLVPHEAQWKNLEQIMYAANSESISKNMIKEIIDIAIIVNADIQFVNVKNYDPVFEIKQDEINWDELFENINSNLYFDKHTIYGNDTIDELKKYSQKINADMIVFVGNNRGFWGNLIRDNISKKMALTTTIPMMVLHLDDKL